jgi:DNA-binding LacI/PurR family transcriptional regulator
MCGNDKMAIGAMRAVHQQGLRIPEDISVMGLDDLPQASYTIPGLTTVHHQLFHMGRRACERLLQLFRREVSSCQEFLPTKLIERESTAPPRA